MYPKGFGAAGTILPKYILSESTLTIFSMSFNVVVFLELKMSEIDNATISIIPEDVLTILGIDTELASRFKLCVLKELAAVRPSAVK